MGRFNNDDGRYTINTKGSGKKTFVPTVTKDGHNLLIIKGSGLEIWDIDNKELFPERKAFGEMKGSAVAIALMADEKLIGIAFGRDNSGTMTFDRIQKGDTPVTRLAVPIKVNTKKNGDGSTVIDSDDADKLADLIVKSTTAGIGQFKKLHVAEADIGNKSPTMVAAAVPKEKPNYLG